MATNFESNFFTLLEFLDAGSRLEINALCTRKKVHPQEIIYRQGDAADSLYIISSGVVEVFTHSPDGQQTRSVGVMARGEFFGDLAALTGQPRLAAARALEPTELLQIEKLAFLQLLEKIPKMGAYFARNLARRLHKTSTEAHLNVYEIDLTGNLRHFDLLTIFQAITNMERTGELQLKNPANELIGSFFFRAGRAEQARFAHLEGIEAVWEGFLHLASDGTFTFQAKDKPDAPVPEQHQITLGSTDLLIQGCSRRDSYQALSEPMRQMQGRLSRVTETLAWTEPETEVLAGRIWELIAKRPQPIASLWRRLNYSSFSYLDVVSRLITSGHAEWQLDAAPETPAEAQPPEQP